MSEQWFIEGFFNPYGELQRVPVRQFPFIIGREPGLPLTIPNINISREHASIGRQGESLMICDLGSTNGTSVNGRPISEATELQHGDVVHFAEFEVRVCKALASRRDSLQRTVAIKQSAEAGDAGEPGKPSTDFEKLQLMISERAVGAAFQPIFCFKTGSLYGHELLGRCRPGLEIPGGLLTLFRLAESKGLAVDLSEVFRGVGIKQAAARPELGSYFLNIHPEELKLVNRLLKSLQAIRQRYPLLRLVLEVHEKAITDLPSMHYFIEGLKQLGIGLAYDDFGIGQSRLMEIAEAPADYLKIDRSILHHLHKASESRLLLAQSLVELAHRMGSKALAEGIEAEEDAAICRSLGFDLVQGYLYGKPGPLPPISPATASIPV